MRRIHRKTILAWAELEGREGVQSRERTAPELGGRSARKFEKFERHFT